MKKTLLLLSAAAIATAAYGAEPKEPQLLTGYIIQNISPNGKWAASDYYGTVTLINVETGEQEVFEVSEDGMTYYTVGSGRALSNDGTLLATSEMYGDAIYYEGGEWKTLDMGEEPVKGSSANSITPDGSRICGILGLHEMTLEDVTMCLPAVWTRQEDGTFGKYTVLPHPTADYTGRAPQYIMATDISYDGHTIVGQIIDCRGSMIYPIVWKEDAEGKWSYSLPAEHLTNPNHVTMPENPGDSPAKPNEDDFLTDEQLAEYNIAFGKYMESGYNEDLYVTKTDYMSEENKAKWEAALAAWKEEYNAWQAKYDAFDNAYWEIFNSSPNFEQNQITISPDGKYFAVTNVKEVENNDPMAMFPTMTVNSVWVMSTENQDITKYEGELQLSVKMWAGEYVTAVNVGETGLYDGYLLKDGKVTSLYDYLAAKDESIKEWMDLNMTHETEIYNWETDQVEIETVFASGLPVASEDMSIIASWTNSNWGTFEPETYLFDLRGLDGVASNVVRKSQAAFDAAGNLCLGADVAAVAVYDLAGTCVLRVDNPAATLACDLAAGLYLVTTTYTDGTAATAKLVR